MPRRGPESFISEEAFKINGQSGPAEDCDLMILHGNPGAEVILKINKHSLEIGIGLETIHIIVHDKLLKAFNKRTPSNKEVLEALNCLDLMENLNPQFRAILISMLESKSEW